MTARGLSTITIRPEPADCGGVEPFALRVLGDAMRPEFDDGDIIVVEPDGLAGEGSFVVARHGGEWLLRALRRDGDAWALAALDPAIAPIAIANLSTVRGVVIQKTKPGRRRATKRYVE